MIKSLPYFPELSAQKCNRVVTKHFTNLSMCLHQDQFSMLNWLIYQSKADNTIIYSTHLLTRYSAAIKESVKMYGSTAGLKTGIKHLRAVFKALCESGYLLSNYDKKVFTINPMLSYRAEYMRPNDYTAVCKLYFHILNYGDQMTTQDYPKILHEFCRRYSEIVAGYMKKKKLV